MAHETGLRDLRVYRLRSDSTIATSCCTIRQLLLVLLLLLRRPVLRGHLLLLVRLSQCETEGRREIVHLSRSMTKGRQGSRCAAP